LPIKFSGNDSLTGYKSGYKKWLKKAVKKSG